MKSVMPGEIQLSMVALWTVDGDKWWKPKSTAP